MKEKLKDRYLILAIAFIIFGVIIVTQLVQLQIVNGKKYYDDSRYVVFKERKVPAPRGKIEDRNMVPIAINREGFTIHIVNSDLGNDQFNEMLLSLADILVKNGDQYNSSLSKYLTLNPLTFNGLSLSAIEKWEKDKFKVKASDVMTSPEAVFKYLRDEKFMINEKYTNEEAYKIMTIKYEIFLDQWKFDTGNSLCLARNVSWKTVAEVEEKHHLLPGISTDVEPVRQYVDSQIAAHIVGYVRTINEKQYENWKDEGYSRNDIVGQTGIELDAERYLRGQDGQKRVEVDTNGKLLEGVNGVSAIPGNDVVLTIDMNLQKVAMESLAKNIEIIRNIDDKKNFHDANAGAVIAIDVNSGEILAMASYPSYDPAVFLASPDDKDSQKAITELLKDEVNKPLRNRTIQDIYAPGSTFKPLIAIAGLEEGIITPTQSNIYDNGIYDVDGKIFRCLEFPSAGHGNLDLTNALKTSCNIYFNKLGVSTTIDKIDKWAKYFGLGEYTGIDISGEAPGIRGNKEYKKKQFSDIWRAADTAQTSIGQLYNAYTPLQLVNYISTIASGGKLYKPHLTKSVIKYDGSIVNQTEPEFTQVPVSIQTIEAVRKGMVAVANYEDGTAVKTFRDFPITVAGKTGTAETGRESKQSSNALFVCYAPAENPKIAIAVVVEKGVWGSYTAPIAKDILAEYFGLNHKDSLNDTIVLDETEFTR